MRHLEVYISTEHLQTNVKVYCYHDVKLITKESPIKELQSVEAICCHHFTDSNSTNFVKRFLRVTSKPCEFQHHLLHVYVLKFRVSKSHTNFNTIFSRLGQSYDYTSIPYSTDFGHSIIVTSFIHDYVCINL